jgi:hypothetical protein
MLSSFLCSLTGLLDFQHLHFIYAPYRTHSAPVGNPIIVQDTRDIYDFSAINPSCLWFLFSYILVLPSKKGKIMYYQM